MFGPFVTDPSCLFDPTTHQFFLTALTLGVDSSSGGFTGQNQLDIAVTAHPTGARTLNHVDVTDDGTHGTPVHPFCPCIGDYPHIGVDSHGFYITTNEYSFFGTTPCATILNGEPDPYVPEAIQPLDGNDSRMQQVTYAGGVIYGALDTGVTVGGSTKAGIAYFVRNSDRAAVGA